MRRITAILAAGLLLCMPGHTAPPTPEDVTIDIGDATAPSITVFRANDRTYRVTLTDGTNDVDLTGTTFAMSWKQNANSTQQVVAAAVAVDLTAGIVDYTFTAADLNFKPGRYLYEVLVTDGGGSVATWNQGDFIIRPSPAATGASPTSFGNTLNWNTLTSYSGNWPFTPGAGITFTTNATALTISSDGLGDVFAASNNVFTGTNSFSKQINLISPGPAIVAQTNAFFIIGATGSDPTRTGQPIILWIGNGNAQDDGVIAYRAGGIGTDTVGNFRSGEHQFYTSNNIVRVIIRRGGNVEIQEDAVLVTISRAEPPAPVAGMIYFDSSSNKHRGFDGTIWNDLY